MLLAKTLPAWTERNRDLTKWREESSWTFGILHEGNGLIELLGYKHMLAFKKRKNDSKGRAVDVKLEAREAGL